MFNSRISFLNRVHGFQPLSMRCPRFSLFIPLLLSLLFFTVANLQNSAYANEQTADTPTLEKVSLQLKWLHQFQFAGYYAAKKKGFYEEFGLDVTLKERDVSINHIEQVIDGESEYGIADSMVMLYQAKGAPITIVSAIFQHSPQVFVTLKNSGIASPYDLTDKNIAFYKKDTDGFPLLAMMHENQLDIDLERVIIKTGPDILANKQVDAYPAYVSNEPYYFYKNNIDINIIDPRHYGVDLYGDLIFTHNDELKNHPQRVEKFRQASIKGWEYALDNKVEIINYIINELGVDKTFDHLMFEANAIEKLVKTHSTSIGELSEGRLRYIENLLIRHNLIESELNLRQGIYKPENQGLQLGRTEQAWIKRNPEIKVAIDQAWHPIEYVDNNGDYTGVVKVFLDRISSLTGLKFVPETQLDWNSSVNAVKAGEIEMFSAIIETPERNQYVNFTPAYLEFPMVVATRQGENYIRDLEQLNGQTLAVVKNYAAKELIQTNYPKINLLYVDSVEEGLRSVHSKNAYGYVDNVAVIGYKIRELGLSDIQISGETPFSADVKMAVIKELPELHSILSKAINSISEEERKQMANQWLKVDYKRSADWQELLIYIAPLVIIVLVMLFYTRKIRQLNKQLQSSNKNLQEAQNSLQASHNRLEILSVTDFLTGAFNRQYTDTIIEHEINRASRHHSTFSVLLIDLDNFKKINDDYGHLVGDEVIKQTYITMAEQIRKTDTIGRWGGEEFLTICPETDLQQATYLANKFINQVEKIKFEHGFTQTISIGIAQYQMGETANILIERADNNLYEAKAQGKNCAIAN